MISKLEVLAALDDVNHRMAAMLESLVDGDLTVPCEPGINPPIWEVGHSAFFYELFVLRSMDGSKPAMPGYDEVWDSFEIKHRERWREGVVPDKKATLEYYHRIMDETRARIETRDLTQKDLYLYRYAIHHQHMHLESLLWCRQTLAQPAPPSFVIVENGGTDLDCSRMGDAHIPAGDYPIGVPACSDRFADEDFGFDNEKPAFQKSLEAFSISKTLVSNGEFIEAIQDGLYENPEHWCYGGQLWLRDSRVRHPASWRQCDQNWQVRIFDQWYAMNVDAPVLHVSFWEAEAFARWQGRRLPTEFEWEAAARGKEALKYPWGNTILDTTIVDMDAIQFAQGSVTDYAEGVSPYGCLQMLGTAWEWTSSQFLPYAGFITDMYPYMSTLQFGDHKVTKGGSCATSSCLIRSSYRQAYHPDRRDVFVGFRTCAQ